MNVCNLQKYKLRNSLFMEHGISLLLLSPEKSALVLFLSQINLIYFLATCLIDAYFNVLTSTPTSFK